MQRAAASFDFMLALLRQHLLVHGGVRYKGKLTGYTYEMCMEDKPPVCDMCVVTLSLYRVHSHLLTARVMEWKRTVVVKMCGPYDSNMFL